MILEQIERLIKEIIVETVKMPVLAKIDKVSAEDYTCDCIELTNSLEETETTYTRVEIPKLWGTESGGVFMSPSKGAIVLLGFLNGKRNHPIISAVMGSDHKEKALEDTYIVKCGDTEIRLDDKVSIKAGSSEITVNNNGTIDIKNSNTSLSTLLKEITDGISKIQTIDSIAGTTPLTPDQIILWSTFSTKIDQLLG